MKKALFPLLIVALLSSLNLLVACDSDESFSADRSNWLTFSADTVSFDTVVSGTLTSTRQFKVFNRNSSGLRISSVQLAGGSNSVFRINVDGTYLGPTNDFGTTNLEIYGKDSLFVFVDVNPAEEDQDAPRELFDELIFTLESGLVQTLKLQVSVQDVYRFRAHRFSADTLLTAGRPFVIFDSLCVSAGATLHLQEGVQLYFHDKANLVVEGRVVAEGTLENPVVFRGDRTDRMFDYLPYDNTPGRWGGIKIAASSMGNRFYYSDIHSASFGIVCEPATTDEEKLRVENSVLHNIEGVGLSLHACSAFVANSQISNTLGNCVEVIGGACEFVHCTMAQFYPWDGGRGSALVIANVDDNDMARPLERALFKNCLITGYASDELYGYMSSEADVAFDYAFINCFINTVAADASEQMVNIRYDERSNEVSRQGNFKLFDTRNFRYDFGLVESSIAIDAGDVQWSTSYPTDRLGINRISDGAPDAGCYEYVPSSE